jgi:meso-butanediol dehydrogenase/(S,S)-butanediol dehydrogenase/diacetyl reductase
VAGKLAGRVAVITAAGAGIGAATARRFSAEGARVVIGDLSGRRAEAVAAEIASGGGRAEWLKMDAADPEGVQALLRRALDAYGRLDVMVNNAGHAEVAPLEEISLESWNRVLSVTLTGTFLGMKYALPAMRRQGGGAIVNTASISGMAGDYGLASYNAAKAGVINLTRSAAIENARHGIRVNCVCPGTIDTRAPELLGGQRADEIRRVQAAANPIARMGRADEIAGAVLFLASDEASFITGAAIVADGGLTAHTGLPPFGRRAGGPSPD